ncbi:MAG: prepilin peptidase [Chloroflexi bacterium]|nr:prepilin peptidase [Chloroflexota bacterium]
METTVVDVLLIAVVSVAAYTDVRRGKIYNALTFPAVAAGLALNGMFRGIDGLADSARAAGFAFALLIIPVALRGVGAGDLKLLVAVGALEGVSFLLFAFLYSALILGAASIAIVGYRRLALTALSAYASWGPGGVKSLPFGVAVAAGCLAALFGAPLGR